MANRGCTIVIKILGGSTGNGEVEDMSLPVALHSPLQVLKDQLMDIVGIPVQDQVLILCDLSDPDRNRDVLLNGRDFNTLRACGIRNGSTLTLHALGISAEQKQQLTKDAMSNKKETTKNPNERPRITLATPIGAADADHSYNGVIFDVVSPGPFEVNLLSISIAGMLGRVRVYARDGPWEDDEPRKGPSPHWWAHRESVSPLGWVLIADRTCRPSWDKPIEIPFDMPIKLLPHTCRALYCHSGLPDDLGIQYQSYKKTDIVAQDAHIEIRPGLGHTGAEPFDEQHGWYRAHRGLSGSVTYTAQRKGWSPFEHRVFPTPLRNAVISMLMCQNQDHFLAASSSSSYRGAGDTGSEFQRRIAGGETDGEEIVQKISAEDPSYTPPFTPHTLTAGSSATSSSTAMTTSNHTTPMGSPAMSPSGSLGGRLTRGAAAQALQSARAAASAQLLNACRGRRISGLPKFVIYNILEYLHWDWFEELYEDDWDAAPYNPASVAKKSSARGRRKSSTSTAVSAEGPNRMTALHRFLFAMGHLQGGGASLGDMYGLPNPQDSDDDEDEDGDYMELDEDEWDEEEGEWVEDSDEEGGGGGGEGESDDTEDDDDEDEEESGEEEESGSDDESGETAQQMEVDIVEQIESSGSENSDNEEEDEEEGDGARDPTEESEDEEEGFVDAQGSGDSAASSKCADSAGDGEGEVEAEWDSEED